MQRLGRTAAIVVTVAAVLGLGGCGEDVPTKDQFIEQMKSRVPDRTLSASVYGCTYDAIGKDRKLLDAALSDKEPSDAQVAKLRTIFSKCVIAASTTTTKPK